MRSWPSAGSPWRSAATTGQNSPVGISWRGAWTGRSSECTGLPQGIAVIELSHRYPAEGGFYLWSKEVFGDFHGFIAGWAYLTTNVFYIPFVLLYLLGIGLYVGGPRARMVIDKPLVAFPAVLCALFLITVVNVVGNTPSPER